MGCDSVTREMSTVPSIRDGEDINCLYYVNADDGLLIEKIEIESGKDNKSEKQERTKRRGGGKEDWRCCNTLAVSFSGYEKC